jgi:hypothetical protein
MERMIADMGFRRKWFHHGPPRCRNRDIAIEGLMPGGRFVT